MIKEGFKNRSLGFYLALGTACLALVSAVLYIALDFSDKTFTLFGFIFALIGALSFILLFFIRKDYLTFVPTVLYSVAFAFVLRYTLPSLSDVWNGVNFIGGNAFLGLAFSIAFLLTALISIVTSFIGVNKNN